jgi:pimeloyl-ACP methyl ester carboxylesterase
MFVLMSTQPIHLEPPIGADQMSALHSLRGGTLTTPDGCRLAYISEGTGPVVVFAHGGLGRGSTWLAVTASLRDRFNCVMLDQRGHGASDWGGGPRLGAATDDLLFVIEQLGPIHALVGHSYGALVALEAARRATPAQIPRLAVYEPPLSLSAPIIDTRRLEQISAAAATGDYEGALRLHLESPLGGMSKADADAFASNPMLRPAFADLVIQAPSIATCLDTVVALDAAEPYHEIDVPTLLLLGSDSIDIPFRASIDALHRSIERSHVAILHGQAHMAIMFAPHLVADALGSLL